MAERTIRRTFTLRSDAMYSARIVADCHTSQTGRVVELIVENHSRRPLRFHFGNSSGAGRVLERRLDPRGLLRADRESGLPSLDVAVEPDGSVAGVKLELVWPPLEDSERA